jgi:hypothetical protein
VLWAGRGGELLALGVRARADPADVAGVAAPQPEHLRGDVGPGLGRTRVGEVVGPVGGAGSTAAPPTARRTARTRVQQVGDAPGQLDGEGQPAVLVVDHRRGNPAALGRTVEDVVRRNVHQGAAVRRNVHQGAAVLPGGADQRRNPVTLTRFSQRYLAGPAPIVAVRGTLSGTVGFGLRDARWAPALAHQTGWRPMPGQRRSQHLRRPRPHRHQQGPARATPGPIGLPRW